MPGKKGLYENIHAKRKRIEAGSGEKMRKPGAKGAPSAPVTNWSPVVVDALVNE